MENICQKLDLPLLDNTYVSTEIQEWLVSKRLVTSLDTQILYDITQKG